MLASPYDSGLKYFSLKNGLKYKTQHKSKARMF